VESVEHAWRESRRLSQFENLHDELCVLIARMDDEYVDH
jgi:hypothetical protein